MTESPKLYSSLAPWWALVSAPEEYEEEADYYRSLLESACAGPMDTVLELGSGGGNNAWHMKQRVRLTLVDFSEEMLAVSRRLNPECEHLHGDMRTLRLNRTFDAVFVHDAVAYMTTEEDLRAAMVTAYVHCRAGGATLFAPNHLADSFKPSVDHGGHDGDGRTVRYLERAWDPDPTDSIHTVDYAFLLCAQDGTVSAVHDRHICGLFSTATWLELLSEVGFVARPEHFEHSEPDEPLKIFVAQRP